MIRRLWRWYISDMWTDEDTWAVRTYPDDVEPL